MVLNTLHDAGGGHYGGCGSCVELLLALCGTRRLGCLDGDGDRLLLSKGHASATLYAMLSVFGQHELPLQHFSTFGSPLQGHPDAQRLPILDFSSGSLGQGVAVGIGMALGVRDRDTHVWVILGDGECQEGMVWESAMLAARYRLSNLHVIVDANGEQECGWAHDSAIDHRPVPDDIGKWTAFGWRVNEVDGHDVAMVSRWIEETVASASEARPSVLLARTVKALAPSPDLGSRFRRHHATLAASEVDAMRVGLAGPDDRHRCRP